MRQLIVICTILLTIKRPIKNRLYSPAVIDCTSWPPYGGSGILISRHVQQNLSWKTTPSGIKISFLKIGVFSDTVVQLHWNEGWFARNMWFFKTGGVSQQWSLETGFTVLHRKFFPKNITDILGEQWSDIAWCIIFAHLLPLNRYLLFIAKWPCFL